VQQLLQGGAAGGPRLSQLELRRAHARAYCAGTRAATAAARRGVFVAAGAAIPRGAALCELGCAAHALPRRRPVGRATPRRARIAETAGGSHLPQACHEPTWAVHHPYNPARTVALCTRTLEPAADACPAARPAALPAAQRRRADVRGGCGAAGAVHRALLRALRCGRRGQQRGGRRRQRARRRVDAGARSGGGHCTRGHLARRLPRSVHRCTIRAHRCNGCRRQNCARLRRRGRCARCCWQCSYCCRQHTHAAGPLRRLRRLPGGCASAPGHLRGARSAARRRGAMPCMRSRLFDVRQSGVRDGVPDDGSTAVRSIPPPDASARRS
jgi:hypothetical protein